MRFIVSSVLLTTLSCMYVCVIQGIGAIVLRFGCEEAADLKWQDDVARQLFSSLKLSTNYATRIMYPKVCFELAHLIRTSELSDSSCRSA